MKKAFSLLEFVIVIAIAAVLFLVVTGFLITVVSQNNKATVDSEVRNEANYLLDQVVKDVRKSKCECAAANSIALYGVSSCANQCTGGVGPTPYASYSVSSFNLLKNSVAINSTTVKVRKCTDGCACGAQTAGFVIGPTPTPPSGRVYDITLNLTQSKNDPRSDFCGKVTVRQIVAPRN